MCIRDRSYELTGAQIRDAVFRAAFRVARRGEPLSTRALEEAVLEREGRTPTVLGLAAEA